MTPATNASTSASATNGSAALGASILNTLGAGSGIDTTSLVGQLVAAERAPLDQAIQTRTEANKAEVSALGQVKSGLDSFGSTLSALATGGDLSPQPGSSDPTSVGFALDLSATATPASVSSTLSVSALASAQTIYSGEFNASDTVVGGGTLTFKFGTLAVANGIATGFTAGKRAPVTVSVADGSTLAGIASAINGANAGVRATVIDDGTGSRLLIKGADGAANAFTVAAAPSGTSDGLAAFGFGPGTTSGGMALAETAGDAAMTLDGVAVTRPTNSISDLLPGYTLTLSDTAVGQTVALRAAQKTNTLSQAVQSFVTAYNTMLGIMKGADQPGTGSTTAGALYGESAIATLSDRLTALTTQTFGGTTLADLGVSTAQDGTLSVDSAALSTAIAQNPGVVQTLFGGSNGVGGLTGVVKSLASDFEGSKGGYSSLSAQLAQAATQISADQAALNTRMVDYQTALQAEFGQMQSAVSAYKSIGSFLTQQINIWTYQNNPNAVTG